MDTRAGAGIISARLHPIDPTRAIEVLQDPSRVLLAPGARPRQTRGVLTSQPGRNDPCPCGSGSKYKKCCADADERRERSLRLIGPDPSPAAGRSGAAGARGGRTVASDPAVREALRVAAREGDWQVDAVPLNVGVADSVDDRFVGVFVVAGGMVLDVEMVKMRSAEPEEVARLLADRVRAAAAIHDHWPERVQVRHDVLEPVLGALLAENGIDVIARHELEELEDAAASLGSHLAGGGERGRDRSSGPRPMISAAARWAGWGLPPDLVARMFAAATRFHQAKPWMLLTNSEVLDVQGPAGDEWTACVMGNAGEQFGLVLYADDADLMHLLESDVDGPEAGWVTPRGSVMTLAFERRAELPPGMHREIVAAGWPIAGPDAHPMLWCLNTPGGGISRAWATTLTLALDGVARFTAEYAAVLATHVPPNPPIAWVDSRSGLRIHYAGDALAEPEALWIPVTGLEPGAATGPGADPGDLVATGAAMEAMRERDQAVVADFHRWLADGGAGRRPLSASTARFHARIAESFVDCLVGHNGAGLGAVHERDLRDFLFEWFPRKVRVSQSDAMRAPVSLTKFFDFLAVERGIVCPWAGEILDDRAAFWRRWSSFPGGHWWDEPVAQWMAGAVVDLDARALVPSAKLGDRGEWGSTMGIEEARLHGELSRLWLRWREEAIASGVTDVGEVVAALERRQREWELAPHPGHEGRSPVEVVRRERRARARRKRD